MIFRFELLEGFDIAFLCMISLDFTFIQGGILDFIIVYLPKATVQYAKASIPLQMGVAGGEIMQAIAILSVLITAPIGGIGINITADKMLKKSK